VLQAIGGSTNGLVHLTAIAGRLRRTIDLAEFDRLGRETSPVLVDLKPSGEHYMEHSIMPAACRADGREIAPNSRLHARCHHRQTLARRRHSRGLPAWPGRMSIRSASPTRSSRRRHGVLHGNLAPRGAVHQAVGGEPEAAAAHEGRAVVFDSVEDMTLRLDDPALDVTADDVLVLRNAGPKGAPGMPEAGYLPIPKKLARARVSRTWCGSPMRG
jgi:dihydroxy-acid dehydratase